MSEEQLYIYGSTEGIQHPKIGDLKLRVISQWDFTSEPVCFRTQDKTFGGGTITIPYILERRTEMVSKIHSKWEIVEKINPEIKQALEKRGYTIALSKLLKVSV